jgi:hypothetical protein
MSPYANVSSVPMLKQFRATLGTFADTAAVALEETAGDINRTLLWLRERQYHHWKTQVRICGERYTQAKLALKRREVFDRAITGNPDSCVDEKKALRIAERRLREAEQKFKRVKAWTLRLEKELLDYRGAVQGLVYAVEVEIPNARAKLDKMIDSIEAYFALAPPEMPGGPQESPEAATLPGEADQSGGGTRPAVGFVAQQPPSALRRKTPSPEVRGAVPLGLEPGDWITGLDCSEALRAAIEENDIDRLEARPDDKVVLVRPRGKPNVVYLERQAPKTEDSGWYIGPGEETELDGYAAVSVSDLVRACPSLADVLTLPVRYLVRINLHTGFEALFDPDDKTVWQSPENRESGDSE